MSTGGTSSTSASTLGYLNTSQTLAALLGTNATNYASTTAPPITINGLSSGIDTAQIIAELMQVNAMPQQRLEQQLNQASIMLGSYQVLATDINTVQSVSDTLASSAGWQAWIPNSTTADASATVGAGAVGGSLTFSVDALAQADSLISSGSVSSETSQVTSGPLLVGVGGGALGIGTLASSNLAIGNHTIAVTQASAGASLTSASAPASSTTITTGTNDTLTYNLDGTAQSLTIAAGTYSASQLASAVQSASGGNLTASINSGGNMVLTTTAQGSQTSLQVTGGDGAPALGYGTTPTSIANGTDGIVTVDGVSNTLSNFTPGSAVVLNGASGSTVNATFTGPLVVGSMTTAEVNTGDGSLQSVVEAINASGMQLSASAVSTGTNQYRLSLESTNSGAANNINLATNAFSGLGSLTTVTAGQDSQITVGTGPGSFVVTNDSNNINGLLPGVTVNLLQADPTTPTTISLQPDGQTMATTVQSLITATNQLITDLNTATSYTAGTGGGAGTAGPLLGDPTAEGLLNSVLSAVSSQAGVNSSGSAGVLGISMNQDGTLSFNPATFAAAYDANPTQVANTFLSGGTSSNPLMSFYESTDATAPGKYDVVQTQAATQATETGATVSGGAVTTGETLTITTGTTSAQYTTTAGETLNNIAAGLNQALASANVTVNASVVNGALQLTSMAYGSKAGFSVNSTASGAGTTGLITTPGTAESFTGTDAAGTINGQAATGIGQLLQGATASPAQGLLVLATATQSQLQAAGGSLSSTVTYQPGIAQALANAAFAAGNPANGTLVSAISGEQSQMSYLNTEIADWNPVLQEQQSQLTNEYTAMETALASLKATQTSLGSYFTSSSSSSSTGG
ncbi:MAG TPA: flagellar filament capping protein FliD [Acidimicrobiales bacterium]|nr:flagellar filament capping protein FliD [Acidimicrobiales bacterium]